ncbi:hypothetical protein NWE60_06180 [Mycoplasmopsis felis]|nr:hypothetical protein [Mycoplasmopsis felis]WAM00963.1 hypothetical protein NWE60_06180 [Mycoplasmopsis felis]
MTFCLLNSSITFLNFASNNSISFLNLWLGKFNNSDSLFCISFFNSWAFEITIEYFFVFVSVKLAKTSFLVFKLFNISVFWLVNEMNSFFNISMSLFVIS